MCVCVRLSKPVVCVCVCVCVCVETCTCGVCVYVCGCTCVVFLGSRTVAKEVRATVLLSTLCVLCYTGETGGKTRKGKSRATRNLTKAAPTPGDAEHTPTSTTDRESSAKKRQHNGTDGKTRHKRECLQSRLVSSPVSEAYLQWKEKVLSRARTKLTTQALRVGWQENVRSTLAVVG